MISFCWEDHFDKEDCGSGEDDPELLEVERISNPLFSLVLISADDYNILIILSLNKGMVIPYLNQSDKLPLQAQNVFLLKSDFHLKLQLLDSQLWSHLQTN